MENIFHLNGNKYDLGKLTVTELMNWAYVTLCQVDGSPICNYNLVESMRMRLLEKMRVPVPPDDLFEQAREFYTHHKNVVQTVKFVREKAKIGLVEAKNWVDERRALLGMPPNPFL